jgi:hypothetical protein
VHGHGFTQRMLIDLVHAGPAMWSGGLRISMKVTTTRPSLGPKGRCAKSTLRSSAGCLAASVSRLGQRKTAAAAVREMVKIEPHFTLASYRANVRVLADYPGEHNFSTFASLGFPNSLSSSPYSGPCRCK